MSATCQPCTRPHGRAAQREEERAAQQAAQQAAENAARDALSAAMVAEIRQAAGLPADSRLCTAIRFQTGELCRQMTKELSAECRNCRPRGCCQRAKSECHDAKIECADCKEMHCVTWVRSSDKDEQICLTCVESRRWHTCVECTLVFEDEPGEGQNEQCSECKSGSACGDMCFPGCPKCNS